MMEIHQRELNTQYKELLETNRLLVSRLEKLEARQGTTYLFP